MPSLKRNAIKIRDELVYNMCFTLNILQNGVNVTSGNLNYEFWTESCNNFACNFWMSLIMTGSG